jgi:hypothetical protein
MPANLSYLQVLLSSRYLLVLSLPSPLLPSPLPLLLLLLLFTCEFVHG